MRNFMNSKPFYIILSLLLAILLFFNANSSMRKNAPKDQIQGEMYNVTIHNVPIQLKYNHSKYFISGYSPETSVYLSGYNRVRIDAEQNEATRTFSVIADLSKKKAGTYEIPLHVENLNNSMSADIEPSTMTVTIEKKIEKKYPVQVNIGQEVLSNAYTLKEATTDPQSVTVSSGKKTISLIDHVEVALPKDISLTHDYSNVANLIAVDKNGQEIAADFKPDQVNVSIKVEAPKKVVPVQALQTGTVPDGIKQYNFILKTKQVEISGLPNELAKVDVITLPVSINGIRGKVKREIPLSQDSYSTNPKSIEVEIDPIKETKEDASTSSSSRRTTKSSQTQSTSIEKSSTTER